MKVRAAVVLSVLLVSCGGDSDGDGGSAASSLTSPGPSTPQLIDQADFVLSAPTADGYFFGVTEITTFSPGEWEATVDWTLPTNTLYMYVATGSCTPVQFASADCPFGPACPCQFAVRSEVATPKPRVLTIQNAAAGTRTLILWNLGPAAESGNYSVRLTSTTAATTSVATSRQMHAPPNVSVAQKPRVK